MGVRVNLLVVIAGLVPAAWAGTIPGRILHPAPERAVRGEPVPISVVLEGVPPGENTVTVYARAQGDRQYESVALRFKGQGKYAGMIPAWVARSLSVSYYIDAQGPDRLWSLALGSEAVPFRLDLMEPAVRKGPRAALIWAGAAVPFMIAAVVIRLRQRRRRRAVLERIFWVRTLAPLVMLRGYRLTDELTRMAKTPLDNPVEGSRRYSRSFLVQKLQQVRTTDYDELEADRDRYLGPDVKLPAIEDLQMVAFPARQGEDQHERAN